MTERNRDSRLRYGLAHPKTSAGSVVIKGIWKLLVEPKHERHKEVMEWSGPFDPKEFDAKAATKDI